MIDCKVVGVPESLVRRLGFTFEDFMDAKLNLENLVHLSRKRIILSVGDLPIHSVCVGHSGGKDSVLVRWLTDTCPTSGLSGVVSLHNPKIEGPNAVHGITQRFLYSECSPLLILKGSPAGQFNLQIDGTRKAETARNDGRSTDFIKDGIPCPRSELPPFVLSGLFGMSFCYPIFDWLDIEVWAAIDHYQIPFSREYLTI